MPLYGGSSGGAAITVKEEGVALATDATSLDFVGAGVTASGVLGAKTITIPGASAGVGSAVVLGLPTGVLQRSYTFDSTVESWTTDVGTLTSTGSKLRCVVGASNMSALEPVGAANVADGEVQVDIDVVSGTVPGVIFRATDASNHYLFQVLTSADATNPGKLILYKKVAGAYTDLGQSQPYPLIGTAQVRIMVRFVGSLITAYANGGFLAAWEDSTYTTGRVGVFAYNSTNDYDNVKVYGTPDLTTGNVGSAISPDWWHSDNAPASPNAANREFTSALTDTRVAHGTPKGTWTQSDDGAEWDQTATVASDLDVWAIARTCSIGDYVTIAFQAQWDWPSGASAFGPFVGFSNGTTFGTSSAVGGNAFISTPFAIDSNLWTGHNSRGADISLLQVTMDYGPRWGMRVKYEAANTWGLYVRAPGGNWRTISTTIAATLTPTHVVYGFGSVGTQAFSATVPQRVRLECFRVND